MKITYEQAEATYEAAKAALVRALEAHRRWAQGEPDGQQAILGRADLRGADLRGVDLWAADLRWANLQGSDLREANFRDSNLRGADLRGVDLWAADLRWANLRDATLEGADLAGATLQGAHLRGARLWGGIIQEWMTLGPLGSRRDTLFACLLASGEIWCGTGHFASSMEEFIEGVEATYPTESAYRREWEAAIAFLVTLWRPGS